MQQGTQRDTGAGLAAPAIAGMVVVIGCLTLCGWIFGIPTLKSVFPGLVSMKVNTALCFILAGLSLGLQSRPPPDPAALRRRLGQVLALVVFCMGFLVLCEWTFGWDLGIDQLVFRDVREPIALSAPGRMAHATAINFCLLGLALFFLDAETRRNRWPAQYLTLTVIGITLVAFMGYFYDIGNLSQVAPYASVALHTVIGFLLLSAGILLARPRRGAMVLVMGATPGGIMVRRMLLPGIFVTILFGGLAVLLQRAGHYGFGFGIALLVTALIALLAGLIWWAARALDRLELERQRGVQAVRQSEERLRMAYQAANIGAFEWNVQTSINVWTPKLEAMYGLKPGEFRRTQPAWEQLVHPEDRAMAVGVVERAFQTFQPEEGEWRVVWPDGSVHWLVGRFQAFKDGAGKPLRLAGVNVDITDRKQAREELRQSEERFRTMADAIPQLAWIARADGHIFWFNRRCYEYTGATPEQLEGWGWRSVADPQVMPKVLEQWRGSIASGQPFSMEFPLRGADGQFRPFLTRVMPLKDNEGRVVLWFGTNTDITELKEAAEALRQSEERLRFALETSHTGAWDLDLADHTAFRSLEHDRIFGYAEPLPQWTYEVFLQHVLPEDRAAVDAKFRQATATLSVWSFECRIRRADGKVRRIWAAGRHRADAAGGMRRMAGIVQDITERKEAEEDLRRLKDELEVRVEQRTAELAAANRELNDFASIVAHDLKAPLRGVSTIARWVQTDYADKLDDKGRQRLAQMNQRVERMDRMIEEILEYSRLGRAEEKRELVALAKLVPLIVHDLAPPPHVRVRLAPGLPVVQGEPVRLRQVFQNLIANAIKYADKPEVDIGVDWTEIDSLWEFRVTDNGPGIEERHFERIFKMFQTLAPKDKTDSTGVGLALVKRIVERAGGQVWVESRLGGGSTFHFTWPKEPQAGSFSRIAE